MKSITIMDMLVTKSFSNILKLKCELIKQKNMGMIFYKEDISKLPIDHPFEFYFYLTKGTILYQNAFPIPANHYKPWMRKNNNIQHLLPYFQSYYETESPFDSLYFENLSLFKGRKFVWFYKGGISDVS
ncbi:hypothetical protein [Ureibacillus manganicus]|uniref:hypothetical protein n=1 Tax=Ureibacillus manganicus TaxID=1266064 RepID=UPI00069069CA|nr:hypothetical protein [Ureibacillus manganicus]